MVATCFVKIPVDVAREILGIPSELLTIRKYLAASANVRGRGADEVRRYLREASLDALASARHGRADRIEQVRALVSEDPGRVANVMRAWVSGDG